MKNFSTLLLTAIALIMVIPCFGQIKVQADGFVGINQDSPIRPLEVVGQIMSSNFDTYPQSKQSAYLMRHYDDPNTHFGYFTAQSDQNNNQVLFGGGLGTQYAATVVAFMTAENTTTTTGTERFRVNSIGKVRFDASAPYGPLSHDLNVHGTAAKTGGGEWATFSDRRLKDGIRPFEDGLEQILKINPVFFKYKKELGLDDYNKEYVGVIAQEIREVAPYTVESIKIEAEPDEELAPGMPSEVLSYDGTAISYMLVNAIKEQQALIQEKDEKISELEDRLLRLEEAMFGKVDEENNSIDITLQGNNEVYLKQNAPNPFSETTSVKYGLPHGVQEAHMLIYDVQGALLKKVILPNHQGEGSVNIQANELPAGEYVYTLVINNKIFESKKMVLLSNY